MVRIEACLASELPPGTMNHMVLAGKLVLLANVEGRLFAMDGTCPGDGSNLAEGALEGHTVTCPAQGAVYDLRTGKAIERPGSGPTRLDDLRTYPIRREEDCIVVDL